MTKCVEFNWRVPVPQELLEGTTADKWVEEKDSADLEQEAFFRYVQVKKQGMVAFMPVL